MPLYIKMLLKKFVTNWFTLAAKLSEIAPAIWAKNWGKRRTEIAKMIGITPAWLTLRGR